MAVTELIQKGKIEVHLENFFTDKVKADTDTLSRLKSEFEKSLDWVGYANYSITDINRGDGLWENALYIDLDLANDDVEAWQDSNDGIEIDTIISGALSEEEVVEEIKETVDYFLSDNNYDISKDGIDIEVDELENKSDLETKAEEIWEEEAEREY